jgi:hypothetical protein
MIYVCDYRQGMDLLTAYTHLLEPQAITAPQHPLRLLPACCVFISRFLAATSNSGESSASHTLILSSQPPVQNSALN